MKGCVLGNVVNTDNDLETAYLELEKVTNMDSNQNEIKVGECKLVHLGRNWTRFIVLLRNLVSDNVRRYRTSRVENKNEAMIQHWDKKGQWDLNDIQKIFKKQRSKDMGKNNQIYS